MPTGFTADIEDGKITDVKDYAASCARAFGAFMHQRDESFGGVSLRYPDPPGENDYYLKAMKENTAEIARWTGLSEEEKYAEWSTYYTDALVKKAQMKANEAKKTARYQSMLAQVQAIDVPSELSEFKVFMINQIDISHNPNSDFIDSYYTPREFVAWVEDTERHLARDAEYYPEQVLKQQEQYEQQCAYIDLMVKTYGFEVER